jgi:hypothetical protein
MEPQRANVCRHGITLVQDKLKAFSSFSSLVPKASPDQRKMRLYAFLDLTPLFIFDLEARQLSSQLLRHVP